MTPVFVVLVGFLVFATTTPFSSSFPQFDTDYPPDIFRNATEIIKDKGYPVEQHFIPTSDGFLLLAIRIPFGKNNQHFNDPRKVVFVQPGLYCGAETFVSDWDNNLPYYLADAGFDVWIVNSRNVPFPHHKTLLPTDPAAWDWSLDELALIDHPAAIYYILQETGRPTISAFIAHSQGGTTGWALFSTDSEVASKVDLFIPMGGFATSILGADEIPPPISEKLNPLCPECTGSDGENWPGCCLGILGIHANMTLTIELCTRTPLFCSEVACIAAGCQSASNFNHSRFGVFISHYPSLTSQKNINHWLQLASGGLRRYDYGEEENLKRYNSTTPPPYDITQLKTNIAIAFGIQDRITNPLSSRAAIAKTPKEKLVKVLEVPFGHLEFIFALNSYLVLWDQIIELLNQTPD